MREAQAAASTLGLEVATFAIRRTQDIVPAFEELKHRTEAIYLGPTAAPAPFVAYPKTDLIEYAPGSERRATCKLLHRLRRVMVATWHGATQRASQR